MRGTPEFEAAVAKELERQRFLMQQGLRELAQVASSAPVAPSGPPSSSYFGAAGSHPGADSLSGGGARDRDRRDRYPASGPPDFLDRDLLVPAKHREDARDRDSGVDVPRGRSQSYLADLNAQMDQQKVAKKLEQERERASERAALQEGGFFRNAGDGRAPGQGGIRVRAPAPTPAPYAGPTHPVAHHPGAREGVELGGARHGARGAGGAPSPASGGGAASPAAYPFPGQADTPADRARKQQEEYARALKAQMEEKEAQKRAAKERERLEGLQELQAMEAARAAGPTGGGRRRYQEAQPPVAVKVPEVGSGGGVGGGRGDVALGTRASGREPASSASDPYGWDRDRDRGSALDRERERDWARDLDRGRDLDLGRDWDRAKGRDPDPDPPSDKDRDHRARYGAASAASDRPRSPRSSYSHAPSLDMAGAAIARAPSAPMGLHHGADGREDRRGSLSANHAHANMSALEMQQAIAGGAKFARFRSDVDVEQAERRRMQQQQNKADLERQIEEKSARKRLEKEQLEAMEKAELDEMEKARKAEAALAAPSGRGKQVHISDDHELRSAPHPVAPTKAPLHPGRLSPEPSASSPPRARSHSDGPGLGPGVGPRGHVAIAGPSPRQHRRDDEDRDNPWAHVDRGGGAPPGLSWGPSSTSSKEPEVAWERARDLDYGAHRHPSQMDHHSHHSGGYTRGVGRYDGLADGPYGGPGGGVTRGVSSSVIDRLRDDQDALRAQVLEQRRIMEELRREVEVAKIERDAAFAAVQGSPRYRRPSYPSRNSGLPSHDSVPDWMSSGAPSDARFGVPGLPFHSYGEVVGNNRSPPTPPRLPFPVGIGYEARGARFEEHTEFLQRGTVQQGTPRGRGPPFDDPELAFQFVGVERPFTAFPTFDRVTAGPGSGSGSPASGSLASPSLGQPVPPSVAMPVQAQVAGSPYHGLGHSSASGGGGGVGGSGGGGAGSAGPSDRPSSGSSPFSGVLASAGPPPLQASTFVPALPVGRGSTPRRQLLEVEQSMASSRQLIYDRPLSAASASRPSSAAPRPGVVSAIVSGALGDEHGEQAPRGVVAVPSPGADEDYSHDFSEGGE